jgi:hypothetical protein
MIDRESVHNTLLDLGHVVFDGEFDMNIVGLRRMPGTTGDFDDMMTLSYKQDGAWQWHAWPCTTDPGFKYLEKPMNPGAGTAVLKPGQYRSSHKLGVHGASKAWAHEALVQCGDLKVWHDRNKDRVVDYGLNETTSHGTSGINIHRDLGDFSAGCQVFKSRKDFDQFMSIVKQQILAHLGDKFTYTLIEWPADQWSVPASAR